MKLNVVQLGTYEYLHDGVDGVSGGADHVLNWRDACDSEDVAAEAEGKESQS